jgi:hypothetical protein
LNEVLITRKPKSSTKVFLPTDQTLELAREMPVLKAERETPVQPLAAQAAKRDKLVQSLADQLEVKGLENQALNNKLSRCQEEVLSYIHSKSWRITSPLRKIGYFMRRKK